MSEKDREGGKVQSHDDSATQVFPVTTAALEIKAMLLIYDRLIALLEETYDDGLDILTDSLIVLVARCREALANGMGEDAGQAMVREMREGLREFPLTLRALLPGIGPRLGESIEHKLGIQFSRF